MAKKYNTPQHKFLTEMYAIPSRRGDEKSALTFGEGALYVLTLGS